MVREHRSDGVHDIVNDIDMARCLNTIFHPRPRFIIRHRGSEQRFIAVDRVENSTFPLFHLNTVFISSYFIKHSCLISSFIPTLALLNAAQGSNPVSREQNKPLSRTLVLDCFSLNREKARRMNFRPTLKSLSTAHHVRVRVPE